MLLSPHMGQHQYPFVPRTICSSHVSDGNQGHLCSTSCASNEYIGWHPDITQMQCPLSGHCRAVCSHLCIVPPRRRPPETNFLGPCLDIIDGAEPYPVLLSGTPLCFYLCLNLKLPCFLIGDTLLLQPALRLCLLPSNCDLVVVDLACRVLYRLRTMRQCKA